MLYTSQIWCEICFAAHESVTEYCAYNYTQAYLENVGDAVEKEQDRELVWQRILVDIYTAQYEILPWTIFDTL